MMSFIMAASIAHFVFGKKRKFCNYLYFVTFKNEIIS